MRKRGRAGDPVTAPDAQAPNPGHQPIGDDGFINDQDAVDSAGEDDDDDDGKVKDKKAGRRKIKIEFIQDKSRRHITFSKRKAGIMKKAYELSTLTGTQVLLLVVSETGLVYTFTTAKLQPLVTQPEGKNLIQACLNAPHGSLPSSMPVGTPIGRSANPMNAAPPAPANVPGGLSIGQGSSKDEDDRDEDESGDRKRQRRDSNNGPGRDGAPVSGSPHSATRSVPSPLNLPAVNSGPTSAQPAPPVGLGASPTSPPQGHAQAGAPPPGQYPPGTYGGQAHHGQPGQHGDGSMYMVPPAGYPYAQGQQGGQQPLGGLAAAAAQHLHWPQQQQQAQGGHYTRR